MPPNKTAPKVKTIPAHAPYAPLFMVVIVALLTIALLLVWRELPTGSKPLPAAPIGDVKPVPAASTSTEQVACESARGKWVECGDPCHGKPGDVCITKCEPQCLCGGIAGWMCPANLACTDYEPSATTPDALGVCRTKPAEKPVALLEITLDKDLSNGLLTSPFEVTGSVGATSTSAKWQLVDAYGVSLESGMVRSDDEGKFTLRSFILTVPTTSTGTLEIGDTKIPVRLPQQAMTVKYYLTPYEVGNDCSKVSEDTQSVVRTNLPIEATLRELLVAELGPGDTTAIPDGTSLVSLKVSGGTATVVFSEELQNYGGGSCNVQAIRAQIEQTLKQFSSIKNVVISVIGKTAAETLQP